MTGTAIETTAYRPISANRVLHIGSGAQKGRLPEEFAGMQEVSFDINPDCAPDIVGDMRNLNFLESQSFAAIYSSHNVEHLYTFEVLPCLRGFFRILQEDGFFRVRVPDIQIIAQLIAKEGLDVVLYTSPSGPIQPLDVLYGHAASLKKGETHMGHKTAFTATHMAKLLWAAGFRDIQIERRNFELFGKAWRRTQSYDDKGKATIDNRFYETPAWKQRLA